ncbi:hypothetical protein ACB092_07G025600 [Castanea dentata]
MAETKHIACTENFASSSSRPSCYSKTKIKECHK